ncbi:hypothetical protein D3C86_1763100 [compost metagenome]
MNLAKPFKVGTELSPRPWAGAVAVPAMRLPTRSLFGDLSKNSMGASTWPKARWSRRSPQPSGMASLIKPGMPRFLAMPV